MVVAFLFLFLSAVIIPEGGIVQGRGKKRGGRSSRKNKNRSGSLSAIGTGPLLGHSVVFLAGASYPMSRGFSPGSRQGR